MIIMGLWVSMSSVQEWVPRVCGLVTPILLSRNPTRKAGTSGNESEALRIGPCVGGNHAWS